METDASVGDRVLDSVHEHTKEWSHLTWFFAVAFGGVLAAAGMMALPMKGRA